MTESMFSVQGMTCAHCANAVTEEISRIDGVREVRVDVATGKVAVTSATPLSTEDVRAAVVEAGYELVGA
jgi:copper chaperone